MISKIHQNLPCKNLKLDIWSLGFIKRKFNAGETCNVGSVVEFSPATREARVRFPDVAMIFDNTPYFRTFDAITILGLAPNLVTVICLFIVLFIFKVVLYNLVATVKFDIIPRITIDTCISLVKHLNCLKMSINMQINNVIKLFIVDFERP